MEEENTRLINNYKNDLEMYENHLKQQIQECKAAAQHGSHIQIYDIFCEIHFPTVSFPVKPVLGTANFIPNNDPLDHLKNALGKVTTSGQGQTLTDLAKHRSDITPAGQGQISKQQQWSGWKGKKAVTTNKLLPQTKVEEKCFKGTTNFTPNENPEDHLKKLEDLGKAITSSGQGQTLTDLAKYWSVTKSNGQKQSSTQQQWSGWKVKKAVTTYKLLPQTKLVEECTWMPPCGIGSLCPTTDGQVWTNDGSMLILLDRKGEVMLEVKHSVWTNGISLSPTTQTLWVCDQKHNITELVSGQLTHRFSTKEVPKCICITASNHVIVGMAKHISKFTIDGKMVCTTMATGTGKPLVCTPLRISECPVTHNLAVADFNDQIDGGDGKGHVVVMDTDFKELFVYRGDISITNKPTPQTGWKPFYPRDVVYDSVGNLIIGDYNNYRVLLISGGGEFLRVIHTDTVYVRAECIDREDVLWTVFGYSEKVKLLQYSSM